MTSSKHLFLSSISVIVPKTQVDIIRSTELLSSSIFSSEELMNNEFPLDLSFALINCSFDRSIPIYLLATFSIIGKNFPVPQPASKTTLSIDNSFR